MKFSLPHTLASILSFRRVDTQWGLNRWPEQRRRWPYSRRTSVTFPSQLSVQIAIIMWQLRWHMMLVPWPGSCVSSCFWSGKSQLYTRIYGHSVLQHRRNFTYDIRDYEPMTLLHFWLFWMTTCLVSFWKKKDKKKHTGLFQDIIAERWC